MSLENLNRIAQAVYNALELMSNVSAAGMGQHVHAGKPGDKILQFGNGEPLHLLFRRRYDGCRTDEQRELVITDGLTWIREARYARHATVDCQTLDGRLAVGRDTRPVPVVAHAYGYSERHVHRLRAEARRYDERNGRRAA